MRPSRTTYAVVASFGTLTLASLAFSVVSPSYRSAYGNINGLGGALLRFLPEALLVVFYGYLGYSFHRHGEFNRLLVILHSGLFLMLSIGLAVPWLGYVVSLFTPVAIIYLSIIQYVGPEYGMRAIVTLALTFGLANAWVLFAALNYPKPTSRNGEQADE